MNFTFLLEIFPHTHYSVSDGQPATLAGSIGDTLLHAPTAMLYHWNMIEPNNEQMHRELMLMPLLFVSYEYYV